MPDSVEGLILISFVIVPGYIAATVMSKLSDTKLPGASVIIIHTITLGLVNVLIAGLLVNVGLGGLRSIDCAHLTKEVMSLEPEAYAWAACAALILCFLVPALLGILLACARNYDWFYRTITFLHLAAPRARQEAWDCLFDRPNQLPLWLRVRLHDNLTVYEGATTFVTTYPAERAIILTDVTVRVGDTEWEDVDADYVLIDAEEIRAIEAYEPILAEDGVTLT